MNTKIQLVENPTRDHPVIRFAAKLLSAGELVVFPTETVYGIGANALDPVACARIFQAKNRPADNPLILHIASVLDVDKYAKAIPEYARTLLSQYAPGPITLVLKKHQSIPSVVTAGQDTICIRIPSHPVAQALLERVPFPVAAPSANISTRPSATTARDAYEDFNGVVPLILDSSLAPEGIESTIVDCTGEAPRILRQGVISEDEISRCKPVPLTGLSAQGDRVTPGSKYKHYAPRARVVAVQPSSIDLLTTHRQHLPVNSTVRILSGIPVSGVLSGDCIQLDTAEEMMHQLFRQFRQADRDGVNVFYVVLCQNKGIGKSVNERILKASADVI